jgi:hypothetical protein
LLFCSFGAHPVCVRQLITRVIRNSYLCPFDSLDVSALQSRSRQSVDGDVFIASRLALVSSAGRPSSIDTFLFLCLSIIGDKRLDVFAAHFSHWSGDFVERCTSVPMPSLDGRRAAKEDRDTARHWCRPMSARRASRRAAISRTTMAREQSASLLLIDRPCGRERDLSSALL